MESYSFIMPRIKMVVIRPFHPSGWRSVIIDRFFGELEGFGLLYDQLGIAGAGAAIDRPGDNKLVDAVAAKLRAVVREPGTIRSRLFRLRVLIR